MIVFAKEFHKYTITYNRDEQTEIWKAFVAGLGKEPAFEEGKLVLHLSASEFERTKQFINNNPTINYA